MSSHALSSIGTVAKCGPGPQTTGRVLLLFEGSLGAFVANWRGWHTIRRMRGKEEAIRAFMAIALPTAVQVELGQVNDVLAGQVPAGSVRWVQPHLMHLTLRFLGDTAVAHLPTLTTTLDQITAHHAPFTLKLADLGCFPNRQRPRVIWAGLTGDVAAAQALQADIEQAVQALGWAADDKPFRAHLTLGRVKDGRPGNGRLLRDISWGTEVKKLAVPVTAVHLIESQLRPSGPIYTTRHISQLGKP